LYKHGDALEELIKLNNRKFDLIITSPPYNTGKEYEKILTFDDYIKKQEDIIANLVESLNDTGSLCWQVGNSIDNQTKEVIPLDIIFYPIFKKFNLILRNRIVWHFGHGLHASNRFSGRYETILWFTKSDKYVFNLDDVRIPSKYPGKRSYKGPKRGQYSSNPKGKNPSDVWEIVIQDWEKEIWEIPNVNANHREKTQHPCQYPIELVERCILALTNEGDWILDPFAGVGSTLLAAYITKRNAIGIELFEKYIKIGEKRFSQLKNGKLNYRPIDLPIFDNKKSNLSKIPNDFGGNNGNM
ncbi:MAG: DNA-methyltransferase, partial [Anaerolineaceae bacterium]